MALVSEIAADVFRISVFRQDFNLQFNHFLVRDDEPLLFHTGLKSSFPLVYDAVRTLIDPARLRWISFSHFESDECGALNEWLARAPHAQAACSFVGAMVSVNDFAIRPALAMTGGQALETGARRFRFIPTPHVPHGWDAGVLFEETSRTLLCSDLFHHIGDPAPLVTTSLVEATRDALIEYQGGPFANYVPYTHHTGRVLNELAELSPATLAVMHGSSFTGDCAHELRGLAGVMRAVLGPPAASFGTL